MIFDFSSPLIPLQEEYDVVIAGAGVAGIIVALQLAGRRRRVLLLEGGDFEASSESQSLYEGPLLGRPYFDLGTARLRFLGGTSNHWAGLCRPLDRDDFLAHGHIPESGWPIEKADLDPYLAEACEILEISPDFTDVPIGGGELTKVAFRYSGSSRYTDVVRFRDKYQFLLDNNPHITLLLNANLVDLRSASNAQRAETVVATGYDGEPRSFRAKTLVLAMGGIENARFLLNLSDSRKIFASEADLIGRYFLEHLHYTAGHYATSSERTGLGEVQDFFATSPDFRSARAVGAAAVQTAWRSLLSPLDGESTEWTEAELLAALNAEVPSLAGQFDTAGTVVVIAEQVPNPSSRVLLVDELDRFGQRRIGLDWRLVAQDARTVRLSAILFARRFAQLDWGRVRLARWVLDPEADLPLHDPWGVGGYHHMGTTRMAQDRNRGVVDGDCRLFALENAYVAGSSVFPTGGHANPTLTIVQLALRLARHLDEQLG